MGVWWDQTQAQRMEWTGLGAVKEDAMAIRITQHVDLPPVYICPTCLKPTPFQAEEHWQVCGEHHFAEVRAITFANGDARRASVPVEKPVIKWPEPETPFGIRG
jgi:hypothetical protein